MRKIIKLGCLIFISLIIGDIALATEESGRVSIPWKDFRGLLGLDKDEENFDQRINEIQSEPETAYIAGTLPIRIQIPTAGQIYRFAKTIVSEEPVKLKFTYTGNGIMWMIKGVILFLILWVLYRIRSRISRTAQALRVPTRSLQNNLKAKHIPFTLFALMLLFWFISRTLSIILLFFLLLSLISLWQASRRQKRLSKETELKEASIQV